MFVAKAAMNDQIQSAKNAIKPSGTGPKINWDDFNYPPLLKIIHYDITEVEPEKRLTVRLLWLAHVLIFVESFVNIINNIAAAAQGASGIRIFYSFLFLFAFNPIQGQTSYIAILQIQFSFLQRIQRVLLGWVFINTLQMAWVTFSFVTFLGFNGFMSIGPYFDGGMGFEGVLAIVESCLFLITAIISGFTLFKAFTYKG